MLLTSLLSILAIVGAFLGFTSGNVLLMYKRRFTNHDDDDDDDGGDDDDDPWERSYEFFQIPTLICNQTFGGVGCGQYNAVANPEECSCNCPRENASFFYDGNDWTCQPDSRVRDFQDCQNIDFFSKETQSQNLYTLKISDNVLTKIPYKGKSGWTNCEVHLNSSWVLGCNGQKLQQSLGYLRKIRELFVIFRRRGSRKFCLQVKSGVQNASLLQGRIINLGIRCTRDSSGTEYFSCLIFKTFGQLSCPVSFTDLQTSSTIEQNAPTQTAGTPTKLTSMATTFRSRTATTAKPEVMVITLSTQPLQPPPLPSSPTPTTKTASLTTLKPQVVITSKLKDSNAFDTSKITIDTVIPQINKTIGILPSLHIVTRSATSSLQTPALHSFTKTSQTRVTPSQFPFRPSSGQKSTQDDQSSFVGLISGVTVSIALLIGIIVGFIVYRRCPSKNTSDVAIASTEDKNKKETVEMGCLHSAGNNYEEDDDGYNTLRINKNGLEIYASNYRLVKDPTADSGNVYAPLNIPDGQNIYGHKPIKPDYNMLQNSEAPLQNGPVSIEQPVYNTLEELPIIPAYITYAKKPVYNVLEAPGQLGDAQSSGEYGSVPTEGQIYNTLEDPKYSEVPYAKGTNEPIYNVLEDNHHHRA